MKVTLGAGIVQVMSLDDPLMRKEIGIESLEYDGRLVTITAPVARMREFLSGVEYRTEPGWDQPLWYASSARAAAKRIRAALADLPKDVGAEQL